LHDSQDWADGFSGLVVVAVGLQIVVGLASTQLDPDFVCFSPGAKIALFSLTEEEYLPPFQLARERDVPQW
jgi:hypothetical protein